MPRILIISPHFPPTNAADMQRVRLLLPYFQENGWQAEVLAVAADNVASPQDDWLVAGLPDVVPVQRVASLGLGWGRVPGLGSLTFRALGALRRAGDERLRIGRFDLVFFSTTQFGIHVLGSRWKRKFGVPFVMDYQDPWVSDYYRSHPAILPPGGRLKYAIADWLNRRQEPRVLRECASLICVSAAYPEQLQARYPNIKLANAVSGCAQKPGTGNREAGTLPFLVLPFPGDERDLQRVREEPVKQSVFDPHDGCQHWVYIGVIIPQMGLALRAFFQALAKQLAQQPEWRQTLRLHFIGTSYAAAGRGQKQVEPLAREFGLGELVQESPDRIPYSQTLRCLLDADALIVPGSDDPGYTASKIYPYLLAEKPLLAVFHENSSVVSLLQRVRGGVCVPFATGQSVASLGERIHAAWFAGQQFDRVAALTRTEFEPHTARAQAQELAQFFERILPRNSEPNGGARR